MQPQPLGKTGFFQAGTLSSISSSIPSSTSLIAPREEPVVKVNFEAWTRNASNYDWASGGMTWHTSIDEPLNGAETGEYDIYLDLLAGAFIAVNSQTKKSYTWICEFYFSKKPIYDEETKVAEIKTEENIPLQGLPADIQTGCCILDEDFDIMDEEHKQAILTSNVVKPANEPLSSSPESIMENRWYEDKLGIVKVVEKTIAQAIDSPYSDERVQRERIYTLNALLQHISILQPIPFWYGFFHVKIDSNFHSLFFQMYLQANYWENLNRMKKIPFSRFLEHFISHFMAHFNSLWCSIMAVLSLSEETLLLRRLFTYMIYMNGMLASVMIAGSIMDIFKDISVRNFFSFALSACKSIGKITKENFFHLIAHIWSLMCAVIIYLDIPFAESDKVYMFWINGILSGSMTIVSIVETFEYLRKTM